MLPFLMVNKQALSNWLNRGKWDFVIPWWHVLITFHCSLMQWFLFFLIFIHLKRRYVVILNYGTSVWFYKWKCMFVGLTMPYRCCRWTASGRLATLSVLGGNIFRCWLLSWRQWRFTINFILQLLRGTTQK